MHEKEQAVLEVRDRVGIGKVLRRVRAAGVADPEDELAAFAPPGTAFEANGEGAEEHAEGEAIQGQRVVRVGRSMEASMGDRRCVRKLCRIDWSLKRPVQTRGRGGEISPSF